MAAVTVVIDILPIDSEFGMKYRDSIIPAWVFLSALTTLILTLLISFRLVVARRQISSAFAGHDTSHYSAVIAIVVESAAPYTIFGLIVASFVLVDKTPFVVMFGGIVTAFWQIAGALAPQFIIYRVSVGTSWIATVKTADSSIMSRSLYFARDLHPTGHSVVENDILESSHPIEKESSRERV
jgi:hypothetical protein